MIDNEYKSIVESHLGSVPVKLGALAADLGLEVFKSPMKHGISGLIEPSPTAKSGFRIKINRHESVERQRFTLAHEISHFLLHRHYIGSGVVDSALYRSSLSDRKEVEANKLASQIVMPDGAINRHWAQLGGLELDERISEMAKRFRVSEQAMRIKLGY